RGSDALQHLLHRAWRLGGEPWLDPDALRALVADLAAQAAQCGRDRFLHVFGLPPFRRHHRISSTGSTPKIPRPEATVIEWARTRGSRAEVSAGSSASRKRKFASSFPLFHNAWKAAAKS